MRQWLVLAAIATVVSVGCSHNPAKEETKAPEPAKVAPTPTKAVPNKKPQPANAESQKSLTCTHKSDTRTLEVRTKDKGCEFAYTKGGKESIVATGQNGGAYCMKAQEKLEEKLKTAGYECK